MKTITTFFITLFFFISSLAQNERNIFIGDNIIHLETYGNGDPILIINGGPGMNSEGFRSLAKVFSKSKMAIIYDQRGTGKSKLPKVDKSTITIDAMISDIEVIRNHLKIKKWIVFGHSFGGMLASYYASKFPDKIKGLVLSSSGGINMDLFSNLNLLSRLSNVERDSLNYWNSKIANGNTSYYARLQRGKYLAPAYLFDKSNIPIIAQRLTQGNTIVNQLVYQNMREIDFDCEKELKTFKAPVLIIQGKEDIIPQSIGNYANNIFQNSKLIILEKCGHYGWLDRPDLYFKSINSFFFKL